MSFESLAARFDMTPQASGEEMKIEEMSVLHQAILEGLNNPNREAETAEMIDGALEIIKQDEAGKTAVAAKPQGETYE